MSESDILTQDDLCELLQVSKHTIASWRKDKKGPPYFKAGGIRYRRSDIEKWIDETKKN